MPNSRFALHGPRPSLIHGLCVFFASNSRFTRLFQAALDNLATAPSPPPSQFTVCTSRFARLRADFREQKRHIKLLHIKLFPVAPVTGPPGRVSGQKDLCSLGSEDST